MHSEASGSLDILQKCVVIPDILDGMRKNMMGSPGILRKPRMLTDLGSMGGNFLKSILCTGIDGTTSATAM